MRALAVMIATLAWCPACTEPDPRPPQQYVPDRGDSATPDARRAPGERRGGEAEAAGDSLPPHWQCNPLYYNTRDGCDCGCGIPDPDCNDQGCATPGCNAAACEYCHIHDGMEFTCGAPPPTSDWSCSGFYYGDGACDCGCTTADPDCGAGGCLPPGCDAPTCVFCWDGSDYIECGT